MRMVKVIKDIIVEEVPYLDYIQISNYNPKYTPVFPDGMLATTKKIEHAVVTPKAFFEKFSLGWCHPDSVEVPKGYTLEVDYSKQELYEVKEAINQQYHGYDLWGDSSDVHDAYPEIYTKANLELIGAGLGTANNIKHLFKHNPNEFYLNADQAAWVNKWAEKTTEVH